MKTIRLIMPLLGLLLTCAVTVCSWAGDPNDQISFVEPTQFSGATRLGGYGRALVSGPQVFLIVSQRPGHTLNPRPTIYWYLTGDTDADLDFRITNEFTEPIVHETIKGKKSAGLHSFDLTGQSNALEVGKLYKVSVTLWLDPIDASRNPFSTGFLIHDSVAASSSVKLDQSSAVDLGRAGLWFDMFDTLSRTIESRPDDTKIRAQRLDLLRKHRVFLTFSPPENQQKIAGVGDAITDAAKAEEQCLAAFAANDQKHSASTGDAPAATRPTTSQAGGLPD